MFRTTGWQRTALRGLAGAGLLGVLALAASWVAAVDPEEGGFYPRCPFHALTGLHCPGCGSTRALYQAVHGRIGAAFDLNPFAVLAFPFVGLALAARLVEWVGGVALPRVFVPASWIWGLFWAILAFWVLRNIPYFPFDRLAP